MKFCPKCNSRLILERQEGQSVLMCPKPGCGYKEPANKVEVVVSNESQGQDVIKILEKEVKELQTTPTTRALCPKCGNTKAFFWLVQTRGTDESPPSSSDAFAATILGVNTPSTVDYDDHPNSGWKGFTHSTRP